MILCADMLMFVIRLEPAFMFSFSTPLKDECGKSKVSRVTTTHKAAINASSPRMDGVSVWIGLESP